MLLSCLLVALYPPALAAKPLVIPTPKAIRWDLPAVPVTEKTVICIGKDPLHKTAALAIAREIQAAGGQKPEITARFVNSPNTIVLGEPETLRWLKAAELREVPQNEQGYWLLSDGEAKNRPSAIVCGRTPQATFYGAQTLSQLIRKQGAGIVIEGAKVRDYPSLSWRGAHLFLGNKALPFHKKLIANVFARYKLNHLILQCEQAKWDALGDIAPEWAMPKSDLREEIRYARAHGLTVTPLVSSVSHMRWLLKNDKYGDLAEDPREKVQFNISPGNPRTYEILFSIYDEVLETFEPEYLHIGGDEVGFGGQYPYRSRKRYSTLAEAYTDHVGRLHAYLEKHGVKTMLWADMLMVRGQFTGAGGSKDAQVAKAIRGGLPKDILLIEWHYNANFARERVMSLEEAGFGKLIGAGWKGPLAIRNLTKALADRGHLGFLETTWVGYESSEQNVKTYPEAFAAFLVAAEQAWNGGETHPLPFNPRVQFEKAYALSLP